MWLIVGLGNPGEKYSNTRHNIGQMVLERFAAQRNLTFRQTSQVFQAECRLGEIRVILALPQTWMNESGLAVHALLQELRVSPSTLVVVHDDLDLDFGVLRLKSRGGAGGHNGIRSVVSCLGTDQFFRLKVGIGHPASSVDTIHHVLSPFMSSECSKLDALLTRAGEALECLVREGPAVMMNRFHAQPKETTPESFEPRTVDDNSIL